MGNTPPGRALHEACRSCDAVAVDRILRMDSSVVSHADRARWGLAGRRTPLMTACGAQRRRTARGDNGRLRCVRQLLQAGAVASAVDFSGATALHYACAAKCSRAVVDALLFADPNCASTRQRDGRTPLDVAISSGAEEATHALYEVVAVYRDVVNVEVRERVRRVVDGLQASYLGAPLGHLAERVMLRSNEHAWERRWIAIVEGCLLIHAPQRAKTGRPGWIARPERVCEVVPGGSHVEIVPGERRELRLEAVSLNVHFRCRDDAQLAVLLSALEVVGVGERRRVSPPPPQTSPTHWQPTAVPTAVPAAAVVVAAFEYDDQLPIASVVVLDDSRDVPVVAVSATSSFSDQETREAIAASLRHATPRAPSPSPPAVFAPNHDTEMEAAISASLQATASAPPQHDPPLHDPSVYMRAPPTAPGVY